MRFWTFFWMFYVLASSSESMAMFGTQVSPGGSESTCLLSIQNSNHEVIETCTGALGKDGRVYTAAHCVREVITLKLQVELFCGASLSRDGTVTFKERRLAQEFFIARNYRNFFEGQDVAIAFPDRAFVEVEGVEVVDPVEIANTLLARKLPSRKKNRQQEDSTKNCVFEGFGINGQGLDGVLYSSPLQSPGFAGGMVTYRADFLKPLTPERQRQIDSDWTDEDGPAFRKLIRDLNEDGVVDVAGASGDSGGPLYCTLADGRRVLAGIYSGYIAAIRSDYPSESKYFLTKFWAYEPSLMIPLGELK